MIITLILTLPVARAGKEGWSPAENWSVDADPGEDLLWLLGRRSSSS